jgi:hypothetical protein
MMVTMATTATTTERIGKSRMQYLCGRPARVLRSRDQHPLPARPVSERIGASPHS